MERIRATVISVLLSMIGVYSALSDDPHSLGSGQASTRDCSTAPVTFPKLNLSSFNHIDTAGTFSIECIHDRECTGDSMLWLSTSKHGDMDAVRLQSVSSQVAVVEPTAPVVVSLKDSEIHPGIFADLSGQIVVLEIAMCSSSRTTGKLRSLNVTNLLVFGLIKCVSPITVLKSDFENNCKLRGIVFTGTPLQTLEPGTFTDLPELRYLRLEDSLSPERGGCIGPEMRPLAMKFHCSCEYRWLRALFNNNTALTSAVGVNERIGIPIFMSPAPYFRPVDCANPDHCLNNWNQVQFTINDPCV